MAKKKAKGKRRPTPPRPQTQVPTASPPSEGSREDKRAAARQRREAEQRRRQAAARKRRIRNLGILTLLAAAVAALVVWRMSVGREQEREAAQLAAAAGCTTVKSTETSGSNQHLGPGESTTYDSSPPTHGSHAAAPLSARVLSEPLSEDPAAQAPTIFQAVHSLEHGYIIVWHKGLDDAERSELEKAFERERKVIVTPYEKLEGETKMALTAWGKLQTCTQPDVDVVRSFIDRFREKTAPENTAL